MINDSDYSVESEDEFYEDFSASALTNEEIQSLIIHARQTSDIKLRRLAKEVQYLRWFMPHLLELAEQNSEENNIINLARAAVKNSNNNQ